ncbi:MAG: SUF system NifU family Fe-S cluster assembly protein, partial [Actinobacteria bacterium]|nr:SUF system NifU family Fe-S cluster assembly protein [Actinomycetota bacterium]
MELDSLYQEVILDHYRSPHNKGLSDDKDIQVHHNNPSCGDEITLNLKVQEGKVSNISWDGVGCSISMASASVMSDLLIGKTFREANVIFEAFMELMQSKGR